MIRKSAMQAAREVLSKLARENAVFSSVFSIPDPSWWGGRPGSSSASFPATMARCDSSRCRRWRFIETTNATGSPYATLTFQVRDDGGTTPGVDLDQSANTFTVNVSSVNDAPAGTDGSVTIAEDGSHTFVAGDFGFTDPNDVPANGFASVVVTSLPTAGPRPFALDQPFRVASISKLVAASVFVPLALKTGLNLDGDASDHVGFRLRHPAHPDVAITPRMILSHTSGLRNGKTYPVNSTVTTAEVQKVRNGDASNDGKKVATGAIIGAIAGQIFGHKTKSTVIGAATGAAAGAVVAGATGKYDGCVPNGGRISLKLNQAMVVQQSV